MTFDYSFHWRAAISSGKGNGFARTMQNAQKTAYTAYDALKKIYDFTEFIIEHPYY